ncbi:MAG: ABC transporter ATP-binding protein [Candidatus Bipolaricaulota bacterium]|nr:ABC transporter ATP-binding protein [Candidatus Bipolaricaulota bacterium]
MLKIEGLGIDYGGIAAVKDLTFEVEKRELVAIIGANGAGKTTLLNAIAGIKDISEGTIALNGTDITAFAPWTRVKLGIVLVPEGGRVFPELTVEKNLRVGAYHRKAEAGIERSFREVFRLFPALRDRKRQMAGTLSGGERQMLAIGRALMANPNLLLVDEISMGLMPKLVPQIFAIISELKEEGLSVLLAEQNVEEALSIVNRGYVLENGRFVLSGTAEDLREEEQVKKAYLGI